MGITKALQPAERELQSVTLTLKNEEKPTNISRGTRILGEPHLWEFLPDFSDPLAFLPNDGSVEFLLNN